MSRPFATISVDLDNLWAYQRTHGDPVWEKLASYLHIAVPRMLDVFDEVGIKATVFLVGADAARADGPELLGPITQRGHEVGNHSYGHACWLHRWHLPEIRAELERADAAIHAATGQHPVGFRGPGFVWSTPMLQAVAEQGYLFDASALPTHLGPLMRKRLLQGTTLSDIELQQRRDLFGPEGSGRLPKRAFRWRLPEGPGLVELPVTTVTPLGLPFHQSYLCYLASFSQALARGYFRSALLWCRAWGVAPNLLLHPLDWLGLDDVPDLGFFPGMGLPLRGKLQLLKDNLRMLGELFTCTAMSDLARRAGADGGLEERVAPVTPTKWSKPPTMKAEAAPFRKEGISHGS